MADSKIIKLYGGAIEVKFDSDSHYYQVRDNDDFDPEFKFYPSVTTIIQNGINKSNILIGWAVNCALEVFNESILPGESYDEVQIRNIAAKMKSAHRMKKEKAADIGTISHEWISKYLDHWIKNGKPMDEIKLPSNEAVESCVTGALSWIKKSGFQPTLSEKIIFSRQHKYIGTMDATSSTASVYGRKAVVDWKSSKDLYPDYRFQLAAYLGAIAEEQNIDPGEYDRWLIKLGKEDGSFREMQLPNDDYSKDYKTFLGMIPVYHRMKELNDDWKAKRNNS
jgi:hypothetical protein